MSLYGPRFKRRVPLKDLAAHPSMWRRFEVSVFERDYSRYMAELEEGDALRDEREKRQEVEHS